MQVIKAVREITSLGLKEAKDLVGGAPQRVGRFHRDLAKEVVAKLEELGARVRMEIAGVPKQ
ncbi:ribosomal protein L7/L12 [Longimicrobium sp.]|uniref:ribosomal protein L7/L12 n=1 Tax=Longimicrobium sp. TaxID=2029185 RepID=UPI002BA6BB00|nr:ribosomal protein L7/L12 [Longimicrobium sp.]HSU17366.1 ribosomal protein L7/L12 [Longimicrobium sp.]